MKKILVAAAVVVLVAGAAAAWFLLKGPSREECRQMWSAVSQGNREKVAQLLEKTPALVNAKHGDLSPLYSAVVYTKDPRLVELLLHKGADPNRPNKGGLTALHQAVYDDSVSIVKLLLEHGADPNRKSDKGQSPLDVARHYNQEHMVTLLTAKP